MPRDQTGSRCLRLCRHLIYKVARMQGGKRRCGTVSDRATTAVQGRAFSVDTRQSLIALASVRWLRYAGWEESGISRTVEGQVPRENSENAARHARPGPRT